MSPFALVSDAANRFDELIAVDLLVGANGALELMRFNIESEGPEGLGAAMFEHCCLEWLSRVVRLAKAKDAARAPVVEPWDAWFARALANRKIARELAFARKVCGA